MKFIKNLLFALAFLGVASEVHTMNFLYKNLGYVWGVLGVGATGFLGGRYLPFLSWKARLDHAEKEALHKADGIDLIKRYKDLKNEHARQGRENDEYFKNVMKCVNRWSYHTGSNSDAALGSVVMCRRNYRDGDFMQKIRDRNKE